MNVNYVSRLLCSVLFLLITAPIFGQTQPAAVVNGETISMEEYLTRVQNLHVQDFINSTTPTATSGQIALDSLITMKLLLQYAIKTSLLPTDAEINADLANAMKQETVIKALEKKQYTEAQLKDDLRNQRAIYNVATINQRVTAEEVKDFYDRHPERFGSPEIWTIYVIQSTDNAKITQAHLELKSGKDFSQVAAKYSEDEKTRINGGLAGQLPATDPRLPEYMRTVLKGLKTGAVSDVVTVPNVTKPAWLIIKLSNRIPAKITPFDQIKPQVEKIALFEKAGGNAGAIKKVIELQKSSTIVINLPAYKDMYKLPQK